MDFTPVDLKHKDKYYEFWRATPCRSFDYSLANLWGWQEYYGLEWCFTKDAIWILQTHPEPVFWAPIGNWHAMDWEAIIKEHFSDKTYKFTRVPLELMDMLKETMPDKVDAHEDRGQWEYLYRQEDLANLPGNKFHKKKNHLNLYIKTYGKPDYEPITDKTIKDVLNMQQYWCQWHECADSPSLLAENNAINRVLTNWDYFLNLVGGSLLLDGKMIAFSVGEKLDDENIGVHFEKGLNGYKGVYQAINYEFANHAAKGFKWINRAQDLDEEGLRQAKMTYQPAAFLCKFNITIKN